MKRILLVLLLCNQMCYAYNSLEISILTCAPGNEVYSVFGHSAIRILDKENHTDKVYDFGTFDFDTPNFTYKFLKGKLKYHLSIRNTASFIRAYTFENREVIEQQLQLSELEKKQIIDQLAILYQPENRSYYYSFVQKNCSTDLRDLLTLVGVEFSDQTLLESKRDFLNTYLTKTPWLRLGINMILGRALDKKTNRIQSMFLPNYLKEEIDQSFLHDTKLVIAEYNLNSVKPVSAENKIIKLFSPIIIFLILLLVYILGFQKMIPLLVYSVIGIAGLIITALWVFSGHEEVTNNLNILWCNPLYLLYVPLFLKNKSNRGLTIILSVSLVIAILIWGLGIQCFDRSIIPLLIILGWIHYNEFKKND